jgi:hypothetical protein
MTVAMGSTRLADRQCAEPYAEFARMPGLFRQARSTTVWRWEHVADDCSWKPDPMR